MPEQHKARAKGRKIGRNKKHQAAIYKSAGRLERNRKRALRRHLRANPHDTSARRIYEQTYGKADGLGLSSRGRKLVKRAKRAQVRAA